MVDFIVSIYMSIMMYSDKYFQLRMVYIVLFVI